MLVDNVVFAMLLMMLLLALLVNTITFVGPEAEQRLEDTVLTTFKVLGKLIPGDETVTAFVTSPIVLVFTPCKGPLVNVFRSFNEFPFAEFAREECEVIFLELLSSFNVDLLSVVDTLTQLLRVKCFVIFEPTPFC